MHVSMYFFLFVHVCDVKVLVTVFRVFVQFYVCICVYIYYIFRFVYAKYIFIYIHIYIESVRWDLYIHM